MVTPQDILALAIELAARPDQAATRAAVSRAYYAAFLHCRAIARDHLGLRGRLSGTEHAEVQRLIGGIDRRAGELLANLRQMRNAADYDIEIELTPGQVRFGCAADQRLLAVV